jgi:hypothetical protein
MNPPAERFVATRAMWRMRRSVCAPQVVAAARLPALRVLWRRL